MSPKSAKEFLSIEEMKELNINYAWANFIQYCRLKIPYGQIKVQIVNGFPTRMLDEKPDVRFDKPNSLPKVNGLDEEP